MQSGGIGVKDKRTTQRPPNRSVVMGDWRMWWRYEEGVRPDFSIVAPADDGGIEITIRSVPIWFRLYCPLPARMRYGKFTTSFRAAGSPLAAVGAAPAIDRVYILAAGESGFDAHSVLARNIDLTASPTDYDLAAAKAIGESDKEEFYFTIQLRREGTYRLLGFRFAEREPAGAEGPSQIPLTFQAAQSSQAHKIKQLNIQIQRPTNGLPGYMLETFETLISLECYDRAAAMLPLFKPVVRSLSPGGRKNYIAATKKLSRAMGDSEMFHGTLRENIDLPEADRHWAEEDARQNRQHALRPGGNGPEAIPEFSAAHIELTAQTAPERIPALQAEVASRALKNPQLGLLGANLSRYAARDIAERRRLTARSVNRFLAGRNEYTCELDVTAAASPVWLSDVVFKMEERPAEIGNDARVTVIMAACDSERTIDYAIRSVLNQTHKNLELLVCDDASTDATLDVVRRYSGDSRLKVYRSNSRQGPYNIRNNLIALASGEYVTFQDADDLSFPNRISAQLEALRQGDLKFVLNRAIRTTADGHIVFFADSNCLRPSLVSILGRRSDFEDLGPYRSALCAADTEFYETALLKFGQKRVAILEAMLVLQLWSTTSLTQSKGLEAGQDGYRAPARRAYAESALMARLYPAELVPWVNPDNVLRAHGIFRENAGIEQIRH